MITHALLALVLFGEPLQAVQGDQTFDTRRGTRLEVKNYSGDVTVDVWDRDAVRVQTERGDRVQVRLSGTSLVVGGNGGPDRRNGGDITLTIPSWMAVDIAGTFSDVTLNGIRGEATVETMSGDVTIRGGSGTVSAKSVQGDVTVENASGRIEAQSVNSDIHLRGVTGNISAGTTNGAVIIESADSSNVEAYTVNGQISYDGTIKDAGVYRLTTHGGQIAIAVPESANAAVVVRSYRGAFRSSFPVQLSPDNSRNRFTLTLGSGSARIEAESFNGAIVLRRPGEALPRSARDRDRDRERDKEKDKEKAK